MSSEDWKRQAAAEALALVKPGMKLGLGTGSTAAKFVELLAEKVKGGLDVVGVPTSEATHALAARLGIRLATLDEEPFLDMTVDGADEIDGELRLMKGGGGALLREKIVATASERMVVIADHTKKVETLGAFPLPVEVVPFGIASTVAMIELLAADAGCTGPITVRRGADGAPFVTDCGNYILDCAFRRIESPETLDAALKLVPGVVENGLFIHIADVAFLAGPEGVVTMKAPEEEGEENEGA